MKKHSCYVRQVRAFMVKDRSRGITMIRLDLLVGRVLNLILYKNLSEFKFSLSKNNKLDHKSSQNLG